MKIKFLAIAVFMILVISGLASALPEVEYVKINGDIHESGDQLVVMRGESLDIRVKLQANASVNRTEKDIKVEAYLDGYEYDDYESVQDSETIFDMDAGDTEYVTLKINVPTRAERDYYDLKVRVGARRGSSFEGLYRINLKGNRHEVLIKDIYMPNVVTAGRGFFANVKVQNIGQKDEKDVTVKLEIPELGISEFTFLDEVEADDTTTSEDIVVYVDECVDAGDYDVIVTVEFDEFEKVTKTEEITVLGSDICLATSGKDQKTVVTVPQAQDAVPGDAVVFPIVLTNMGKTAKTYVITVSKSVQAFGTSRVDPGNVVIVTPNKPETVFVYITLNKDVTAGAKDFIVTIQTGDEKQDIPLKINVAEGSTSGSGTSADLRNALEIGLVVLIVILVIVGLVIGFNRLKPKNKSEDEDEEMGQTYY